MVVEPFAARAVLPIAGVVALAHVVVAATGSGYWFDEGYMLAIGRHHLDWGSADQPPVAPALAALMDHIAPDSLVVLRLPANRRHHCGGGAGGPDRPRAGW